MIFNIPWPPNLLAFMELLEMDFMKIFGDFSCHMQLGFFEKFVYHMMIFLSVMAMLLIVRTIAIETMASTLRTHRLVCKH